MARRHTQPLEIRAGIACAQGTCMPDPAVTMEWDLVPDPSCLHVLYRLRNRGAHTVYVLDRLVEPSGTGLIASRRAMVLAGMPGTARLVLGHVTPEQSAFPPYPPVARALAPGRLLAAVTRVPLPLEAWHPHGATRALDGLVTRVTLAVGLLDGSGRWSSLRLRDGEEVVVPDLPFAAARQRFVRGDARPAPARGPEAEWLGGLFRA
jgi:hypothetical protein